MPPARLQRGVVYHDHLRGSRELTKPYTESGKRTHAESSTRTKSKTPAQYKDYMELNEFIQEANKKGDFDDSTLMSDDQDFPKPNVDLLASLLTLGKMIKDQKQLIKRQSRHRETPCSATTAVKSSTSVTTTYSTSEPITSAKISSNEPNQVAVEIQKLCTITQSEHSDEFNSLSSSSREKLTCSSFSSSTTSTSGLGAELEKETNSSSIPDSIKDWDYWERRRRNNLAAKKSREERRRKELEILDTANDLEKENSQLTVMLKRLTSRNKTLESQYQQLRSRKKGADSSEVSSDI